MIKEGLYEDYERREQLLGLARFTTTASGDGLRSLKDYVGALKENQTAIYYIAGDDAERLKASPQLEGFRARGIEVLLLTDPVDSFWVSSAPDHRGQAVQIGDAGQRRSRADPAARWRDGQQSGGDGGSHRASSRRSRPRSATRSPTSAPPTA